MSVTGKLAPVLRKIARSRQRYAVAVVLMLTIIPMYLTLAMPVPIPETVAKTYKTLQSIKPGDYVYFNNACKPMDWPMYGTVWIGMVTEILARGGKIIFCESDITLLGDLTRLIQYTPSMKQLEATPGRGYGVDWIALALHPGDEPSLVGLFSNLLIGEKDLKYGRPYSEYPIMAKVRTGTDLKLVVVWYGPPEMWIRLVVDRYGAQLIPIYTEDMKISATQLVRINRLAGAVMGMAETAALELLTGVKGGPGLLTTDVMNLFGLLLIGAMIIGNLAWFTAKIAKLEVKA